MTRPGASLVTTAAGTAAAALLTAAVAAYVLVEGAERPGPDALPPTVTAVPSTAPVPPSSSPPTTLPPTSLPPGGGPIRFDPIDRVPSCVDLTGTGRRPVSAVGAIFVRDDDLWYYEQLVTFSASGRWLAEGVHIGLLSDEGDRFMLAFVVVTPQQAAELRASQGAPQRFTTVPGTTAATTTVLRDGGPPDC